MLTLSPEELVAVTRYRQPSKQLAELHRQGFYRARMGRAGGVLLERAHFESVTAARVPGIAPFDYSNVIPAQIADFASAKRAEAMRVRTPAWCDPTAIEAIYIEARRMTVETGIDHHVDHKIPLQGRRVSGLHVETNLQILTALENIAKTNTFEVE